MTRSSPFALWATGLAFARLGVEAQAVIAMRSLGAFGLWSTKPSEDLAMVTEKQAAFARAWLAAGQAAAMGRDANAVFRAALRPLGRKTSGNMRRLAKAGPRAPGRRR